MSHATIFQSYTEMLKSKSKYSEDDIIKMLEFLVDNIFVVFAGKVFQQTVGTNCAPLLADVFLYSYEFKKETSTQMYTPFLIGYN